MRLLFVSHSFPPAEASFEENLGGMQRVAVGLHEALQELPDVTLDTLALRTSWSMTAVRTPLFLLQALVATWQRVRHGEVDVVLFSSMVTATLAVPLRGLFDRHGVQAAAIVHGRDVTLPTRLHQRVVVPLTFRALDAVLPVSQATGAACLKRGLPEAKLHVVPNGIRLDHFERPLRSPSALPDRPAGSLLLCSVGRQVERKGFVWFIGHVMPRLPASVRYWLAGDGPEAAAIQRAIDAQGLGERVRRLGRISEDDLTRLYQRADLFVMPNIPVPGDMEGFGVVMLEAGLSGLPTVAARLEGIQDVITEGANGHLVPSGDADAFVDVIMRYVDEPVRLSAASGRAQAHVADTFSWAAVARRYVAVLRALRGAG